MKYLIILIIILQLNTSLYAQEKRDNMWYFGDRCALDFNSGVFPPTPVIGSLMNFQDEGSASISDARGNLLFYTDGQNIWGKNHVKMPNANADITAWPFFEWDSLLAGDQSITQSAVIIPFIGDTNRFYVFSTDGITSFNPFISPLGAYDGLHYSIVDKNLNGGFGDIDTAFIHAQGYGGCKIPLIDSTAEKIAIARHANGVDFWIITMRQFEYNYYAFHVSCSGIDTIPVISPALGPIPLDNLRGVGYLVASKDGKALVNVSHPSYVSLLDFDNETGVVSNYRKLTSHTRNYYGAAFSPNDSIIYVTDFDSTYIRRYQRFSSTPAATETFISTSGSSGIRGGALMLGPDNRIYVTRYNSTSLSVIHDPNNFSNPNYVSNAVPLGGVKRSYSGLPSYYIPSNPKYARTDTSICINNSINIGIQDSTYGFSFSWSPGNLLDDSTKPNPKANITDTTTFIVTITTPCTTFFDTVTISPLPYPYSSIIQDTYNVCKGQDVQIGQSLTNGFSFTWNPTTYLQTINTIPNPITKPLDTIIYIVTISDGCTSIFDTVVVNTDTNQIPNILFSDSTICIGSSVQIGLDSSYNYTYNWTPAATLNDSSFHKPIATPSDTTDYIVNITTALCGTIIDTITINVIPILSISGSNDTTVCSGNQVQLLATGGQNYRWVPSTGLNNDTIANPIATVFDSIHYRVFVSDNQCFTDSLDIKLHIHSYTSGSIAVNFDSATIPYGGAIQLTATGGNTYSWIPTNGLSFADINNPLASPDSTTLYIVTITTTDGCIYYDSVLITVLDDITSIFIPNVFTPNSDSKNESFSITSKNISEITWLVFDRWGEKVFESTSINDLWNGNSKETNCCSKGVYMYYIKYTDINGHKNEMKGNLLLIK